MPDTALPFELRAGIHILRRNASTIPFSSNRPHQFDTQLQKLATANATPPSRDNGLGPCLPAVTTSTQPFQFRHSVLVGPRQASAAPRLRQPTHIGNAIDVALVLASWAPRSSKDLCTLRFPFVTVLATEAVIGIVPNIFGSETHPPRFNAWTCITCKPSARRYAPDFCLFAHCRHHAPRSTSRPTVSHSCPSAHRKR